MLGTLIPHQKKVTIVGAGISGLLMGYVLKKRGFEVRIVEATLRAGGQIHTESTQYGIAEAAAHSLLVSPEIAQFFKELQVELVPVNPDSKARYIFRNGKMRRMPLTLLELLQTLIHFFSKPKQALDFKSASLGDWGHAYVGPAATRFLLSPFITGIFACKPDELNAKLAFPKLIPSSPTLSLFRFFRSKKKASRPQMMAPLHGMQSLVERLREELENEIQLDHPLTALPDSENLILSVPTMALSKLIAKEDPESAQELLQIRYAPLISVTCFYAKNAFSKEPKGVGVLIPRGEGIRALGVLFNSSSFPNRTSNREVLSFTVMLGGTSDPDILKLSDDELNALINQELRILLHADADPLLTKITRWNRAIPVYSQELKSARESLNRKFCAVPGRMVFTNYSREVSIRSLIEALLQL